MKINRNIRLLYQSIEPKYGRLRDEVSEALRHECDNRGWFFADRIKTEQSFALKMETGRFSDPARLEDFYGCTMVVPTLNAISEAEQLVCELYDLQERRPPDGTHTTKPSSDFIFDDLRLYVSRPPRPSGLGSDLDGLPFEIQIKTILQYAWAVATHDLIYKTNTVSWPKERIAFQIKAMLEHAEVAVAEAEVLAQSKNVSKRNDQTDRVLSVISQLERIWPEDALPVDRKRLAESILKLLSAADLTHDDLQQIIEEERQRVEILPLDLSPYAFTLQALAHSTRVSFRQKFLRNKVKIIVIIHNDMDLPDWMRDTDHPRILDIDSLDME